MHFSNQVKQVVYLYSFNCKLNSEVNNEEYRFKQFTNLIGEVLIFSLLHSEVTKCVS
jgi:hypothetical protein